MAGGGAPEASALSGTRDLATDAFKSAFGQFADEQAAGINRARHGQPVLSDPLETEPFIIRFVANQHHKRMALRLGGLKRCLDQSRADAALAKCRVDGQWPEQQGRMRAAANRRHAVGAHQHGANIGHKGQGEVWRVVFAQAIGRAGIAAGAESALIQLFDSFGIFGAFGRESQAQVGHFGSIFEMDAGF